MSMPKPVRPNMATATPLGPPEAQTAQKQYAGSLEVDAQPSAARIRLPEGAARKVSASVRRAHIPDTSAASGPLTGTWKDPDPRRRSSRGSVGSEQACLPGNGGYATPACCPVSTTSWRYGLRRTCRLVTGRSHRPRSTWPGQARLPLPQSRTAINGRIVFGSNNFRSPILCSLAAVLSACSSATYSPVLRLETFDCIRSMARARPFARCWLIAPAGN